MKVRVGLSCALLLASAHVAAAQETSVSLSGSVRVRYEGIDGYPRAVAKTDDNLFSFRARVLAEYDPAGPLYFGAELHDSRVDLEDALTPISTSEVNTAEFVQAYAGASWEAAGVPVNVRAGRFMLNVGARRIVASDDFRNTTNSYAGLRADVGAARGANATFFYTMPVARRPDSLPALRRGEIQIDRQSADAVLLGALVTAPAAFIAPGGMVQASYYRFDEKDRADDPTRDRGLNTFGLRLFRDPAPAATDFDVELLLQNGEISASAAPGAPRLDVAAYFVHAEYAKTWSDPMKTRLALELDYASGDKPGGDYGRFDTLFGARSSEFSPSGLYSAIGRANIAAAGLRLEVEPSARIEGQLAWKAMYLASKTDSFSTSGVRDALGASGSFAGHQLDARVRYWLAPETWRLDVTSAYLVKGRFLETAPNVATAKDAAYLAMDLTWLF